MKGNQTRPRRLKPRLHKRSPPARTKME